jgi:hypothetical protein
MSGLSQRLGTTQADVLRALRRHGFYAAGACGWVWSTPTETVRVLDSLVKRGKVTCAVEPGYPQGVYRPVPQ